MNEHKQLAIRALEQMRGDDLARARLSFRGMTPEQMKQPFGQSGKSHAEILSEYERYEAQINAAIHWVKDAN